MMKDARGVDILKDGNNLPYALHLRGDFTAEHEMGVGPLHSLFGTGDHEEVGIGRYAMKTSVLDSVLQLTQYFDKVTAWTISNIGTRHSERKRGKVRCLRVGDYWRQDKKIVGFPYERSDSFGLSGSYDSGSFEIVAYTPEAKAFVSDLHSAIASADIAVHIGGFGQNPFSRGGLNLSIVSRVPDDQLALIRESHLEERQGKEREKTVHQVHSVI